MVVKKKNILDIAGRIFTYRFMLYCCCYVCIYFLFSTGHQYSYSKKKERGGNMVPKQDKIWAATLSLIKESRV